MPDMPVVNPPNSVVTLIEILKSIDRFLYWIVVESTFINEALREGFQANLDDARGRIEASVRELETVESEESELYRRLELYGLTGASLELKFAIATSVSERAINSGSTAAQAGGGTGFGLPRLLGKALEPVLKWVNLILGSLSKALPVLEAVKEYKEGVELSIDQQESSPLTDRRIFPGIR